VDHGSTYCFKSVPVYFFVNHFPGGGQFPLGVAGCLRFFLLSEVIGVINNCSIFRAHLQDAAI
jgi:hypothetical protein